MKNKVLVKATVNLVLSVDETNDIDGDINRVFHVLNEMDYNFTLPKSTRIKLLDTEITDFEIQDEK